MVESTALEMRHTGNRIVGSNPTLSAIVNPWGVRAFQLLVRSFYLGCRCRNCLRPRLRHFIVGVVAKAVSFFCI